MMASARSLLVEQLRAMHARYTALGLDTLAGIVADQLATMDEPLEPPARVRRRAPVAE